MVANSDPHVNLLQENQIIGARLERKGTKWSIHLVLATKGYIEVDDASQVKDLKQQLRVFECGYTRLRQPFTARYYARGHKLHLAEVIAGAAAPAQSPGDQKTNDSAAGGSRTAPTPTMPTALMVVAPAPSLSQPPRMTVNHRRVRVASLVAGVVLATTGVMIPPAPTAAAENEIVRPPSALDETQEVLTIPPGAMTIHHDQPAPAPAAAPVTEIIAIGNAPAQEQRGEEVYRHSSTRWKTVQPRGARHQMMESVDRVLDISILLVSGDIALADWDRAMQRYRADLLKIKGQVTQEHNRLAATSTTILPAADAPQINPVALATREQRLRIERGVTNDYANDAARLKALVREWLGIDIEPTSSSYNAGLNEPTFALRTWGDEKALTMEMYVPTGARGQRISRTVRSAAEAREALAAVLREYDMAMQARERGLTNREQQKQRHNTKRI
jgi:hypothetical protein